MPDTPRKSSAEHAAMNARAWDEIAVERRQWLDSLGYDAAFFRAGGSTLSETEMRALGPLSGRRVLHLQCATGEDSLSLANRGALVTGLDISPVEIGEARAKAAAAGVKATFDVADVQKLPNKYRYADYDLVYTGIGALVWLDNLNGWAHGISEALEPGGSLVIYDEHPAQYIFEEVEGRLVVVHSYFETEPEYLAGWGHFETANGAETKAEFSWTVGGLITALGRNGLMVEELRELPEWDTAPDGRSRYSMERFPGLTPTDHGKIPAALLLRARKP